MQGELDPSTPLIDRLSTSLATGAVKYVLWSRCTTSKAELLEVAEVQQLTIGPNGTLIKAAEPEGPECDISTDLLLDSALRRRALAADISGLIAYSSMQAWHEILREALLAPPVPSYSRVSYSQLSNADRELWAMVAAKCRDGCKQLGPDGRTAFEKAWTDSMQDIKIRLLLAPLPRSHGAASSSAGSSSSGGAPVLASGSSRPSSLEAKFLNELRDLKKEMGSNKRKFEQPGPKRDLKKRGKPSMPHALKDMAWKDKDGNKLCFNYNMNKGCQHSTPGGSCRAGRHVCMVPGCFQNHPAFQHPR